MAAKKNAASSITQLEKQIVQMEAKLDKARRKQVRDAQQLVAKTKTSLATARKKLRVLRNKKVAAGKIKVNTSAAQKRLRTALKAFDEQQRQVEQLSGQLENAKQVLTEVSRVQRYADIRAREIDKAAKAVEKKLKKKTAGASRRAPKATSKNTARNKTAAKKTGVAKKTVTGKAASKKAQPQAAAPTKKKVTAAKKAATKKAPTKTASQAASQEKVSPVAPADRSTAERPSPQQEVTAPPSPAPVSQPPAPVPVKTPERPRYDEPNHGTTHVIDKREPDLPKPQPVPDRPVGGSLFDKSFYDPDDNV